MIDHFNEIELLSVLPSVLQGSLASSSNHCSIFKICEKKKKVIIHKNGDHMPLVLIGSHFQMGSSTNFCFSYFHLVFFKGGRFSLSLPYPVIHPYKLQFLYFTFKKI